MRNIGIHCNHVSQFEARVLENGLRWAEFFNLPREHLEILRTKIAGNGTALSIHTPLVEAPWYPRAVTWSLLNDLRPERRDLNFRLVEETLQSAVDLNPKYLVVHFPAPSSPEDGIPTREVAFDIGRSSAERLAKLSEQYEIPIMFEGFGPSPLLSPEFLIEVASTYPTLRYCLDCAHTHMASKRDGFDYFEFVQTMAPYIGTLHLWSTRGVEDYLAYRHIPVHPSLTPDRGWADVEGTLRMVLQANPSCPVILEHGGIIPSEFGLSDYREGVEWIKRLVEETLP